MSAERDRRAFRLTARTRLAATYALLVVGVGAVILTIVALFIVFVPDYEFVPAAPVSPAAPAPSDAPIVEQPEPQDVAGLTPTTSTESLFVVSTQDEMLRLLLITCGAAIAVLAVIGAVAGWFVAGRVLRPLRQVNSAARRASHGSLDHRIAMTGPHDEITDLADTFDDMLARLERAFAASTRFAQNASHELRTPLSATKTALEVALRTAPPEQHPLLRKLQESNERSLHTVASLLDLADVASPLAEDQIVSLSETVSQVVEEQHPEIAARSLGLELELEPASVVGDPVLLRQLAENLVANAVVHNVDGGLLRVTTREGADGCELRVENDGAVLPDELVATLTEPFVRAEGRAHGGLRRGRGLGLTLSQAVADRTGAVLRLSGRACGGLDVRCVFPAVGASSQDGMPGASARG